MKEKINDLREQLHSAIEDDDKGKILMISEELDKLITTYYLQYEEKDNSL
ncbi:MAG: Spo0E family sporulation regulatory protein-aspartic acid phosphatase [Tissierellia bacterium]|nr:Spo0E family sporulation regulatory protein-aspartic acid phosphatase [Tissierellia bacterium]